MSSENRINNKLEFTPTIETLQKYVCTECFGIYV